MIVIDPRTGSRELFEPIRKRVNGDVVYARPPLHSGDVAFMGEGPDGECTIGVEL